MVQGKQSVLGELTQHGRELVRHRAFKRHPLRTITRGLSWPLRCALSTNATIRFREPEFLLKVPAKFRSGGGTAAYVLREFYEPEYPLLCHLFEPGMVFVDAGANAGAFSLAAGMRVGLEGRVVAFEPGPTCHELLCHSVRINQLSNVVVRNEALSNRDGEARLFKHYGKENSFGLGTASNGDVESIVIKTKTLASVFVELGLTRLDVMKLDVEGSQQWAIEGGLDLVKKHQPVILIENNIGACRRLGLEPADAFDILKEIGYDFAALDDEWTVQPISAPQQTRSVLCLPRQRHDEFIGRESRR